MQHALICVIDNCSSGLKRVPSADMSLSGDEFTTYKKPLTDSTYTSPVGNRFEAHILLL